METGESPGSDDVPALYCNRLDKTWSTRDEGVFAIRGLDLHVPRGELVAIIGPSGCGKTTFLRIAAGLVKSTRGDIHINGVRVNGPDSGGCLVSQEPALFPWLTVRENVEFGLKMTGMSRSDRCDLAQQWLYEVNLPSAAKLLPRELSSGMRQRVALARALALQPRVLLLDEPFAWLDEPTRAQMHQLLLRIWAEKRQTIVFVTHMVSEALMLADRVVVLTAGPARVSKVFEELPPRNRNQYSTEFVNLSQEIAKTLADAAACAQTQRLETADKRISGTDS